MKKLYSLWDIYEFPITLLFLSALLMGFGNFFQDPNILPYINLDNAVFQQICTILKYTGSFLMRIFPILILVKYLGKRYVDSVPVFNGIVNYAIFSIVTMFVATTDLPEWCYSDFMGLSTQTTIANTITMITRHPLYTGMIAVFIVGVITKGVYNSSRRRFVYGLLSFLDNDMYALIVSSILCALAAFGVALVWPFLINGLNDIFAFIASDIYDPIHMFLYGILEQILNILQLPNLIHEPFWFGTLGGSWTDNFGQGYNGDISIWTALYTANASSIHYGRFITPLYIMNIFALPGMYVCLYRLTTDRIKRRRNRGLLVLSILISWLSGSLVPAELFLFITAPGLFLIHILVLGVLYAALPMFNLMIGYNYTGTIANAMPGTLVSYISYIAEPKYYRTNLILLGIGIAVFFLYFYVTKFYYHQLSADFLDEQKNKNFNNEVIAALGGTANLRLVNSSITNLTVHVYDPSLINTEALEELGANRIINTRAGLDVEFGPRSTNIRDYMVKHMKAYEARRKRQLQASESSAARAG